MKNLTDKKLELFDTMLDDRIEMYGVANTIQYLLENDFTKEDLLKMNFDEADINEAVEDDTELADSDTADVRYEVWMLGYDAEDFCTDLELLLGTYDRREEAIKKAISFEWLDDVKKIIPDDLELVDGDHVEILVETIKNNDPTNCNIDTVFTRALF